MAILINGKPQAPKPVPAKKKITHTKRKWPTVPLDQPGRLSVANLMALFDKSHSRLYELIRLPAYGFPQPDGYEGNHPYWMTATIAAYRARGGIRRLRLRRRPLPRTLSLPDGTALSPAGDLPTPPNSSNSGAAMPTTKTD
jgi:hypothetical protein